MGNISGKSVSVPKRPWRANGTTMNETTHPEGRFHRKPHAGVPGTTINETMHPERSHSKYFLRVTIIPIQIQGHAAQAQVLSFRLMRQPPLIAR